MQMIHAIHPARNILMDMPLGQVQVITSCSILTMQAPTLMAAAAQRVMALLDCSEQRAINLSLDR